MMRRALEGTVFVGAALALHLGLWIQVPSGDPGSTGAGGENALSLAAVTPQVAQMLDALETPPDIQQPDASPVTEVAAPQLAPPPQITAATSAPLITQSRLADLPQLEAPGLSLPRVPPPPPAPQAPEIAEMTLQQAVPTAPTPDALQRSPSPSLPSADPAEVSPQSARPQSLAVPAPPETPQRPAPPAAEPPREATIAETGPPPRPERPAHAKPPAPQSAAAPKRSAQKPPVETGPAAVTTAGSQRQVAKGAGNSAKAGAGSSTTSSLSPAQRTNLLKIWGNKIGARIARRVHKPRRIRENWITHVLVTVGTDGRVRALTISRSSGVAELDNIALGVVRSAGRMPKAPKELRPGPYSFKQELIFR